jgi:hypothetical protein
MRTRASGTSDFQFARGLFDGVHFVVQEIHLAAALQFALEGFADQCRIPGADEGLDREAMRRRRGDDGQVTQPGHGHVEGARDGRCGEGKQIDFGAQLLQLLLLAHAKALLLIDDQQAEVLELHIRLQQLVGADHDVDLAIGQLGQGICGFLLRLEA